MTFSLTFDDLPDVTLRVREISLEQDQAHTPIYTLGTQDVAYIAGRIRITLTLTQVIAPPQMLAAFVRHFGHANRRPLRCRLGVPTDYAGGAAFSAHARTAAALSTYDGWLVGIGWTVETGEYATCEHMTFHLTNNAVMPFAVLSAPDRDDNDDDALDYLDDVPDFEESPYVAPSTLAIRRPRLRHPSS